MIFRKKITCYLFALSMVLSLNPMPVSAANKKVVKLNKKTITTTVGKKETVSIKKEKKVKITSVKVSGFNKKIVKVKKSKTKITVESKAVGNTTVKVKIKYKQGKKNAKQTFKLKVIVHKEDSGTTDKTVTPSTTETPKPTTPDVKPTTDTTVKPEDKTSTEEKKETEKPADKPAEHVHKLTKTDKVEATCTKAGNIEYYSCDDCNKLYKDEKGTQEITLEDTVIKAKGHTEDEPVVITTDATCTEDGSIVTTVSCKDCGVELSKETKTLEALGHDWGDWVVTKASTIDETGVEERVCKTDSTHKETREIPKLDHIHVLNKVNATEPTCEKAGNVTYWICEKCDRVFTDENGENQSTIEAVTIKALGHDEAAPVKSDIVEATCTKAGSYTETVKCKTCGKVLSEKTVRVDPLAHVPGEPTSENRKEPTCTVKGSYEEVIKCKACLTELSRETKEIPALGHTAKEPVKENVVDATCTEGGSWDEVVYCEICGVETNRTAKTSDPLGHNWTSSYDYRDGNVVRIHKCNRCKEEADCTFNSKTVKEPTCVDGTKEYTCTECGYSYQESIPAVKAHDYSEEYSTGWDAEEGKEYTVLSYTHNNNGKHRCKECGSTNPEENYVDLPFADSISKITTGTVEEHDEWVSTSALNREMMKFGDTFPTLIGTFKNKDDNKLYNVRVGSYRTEGGTDSILSIEIYEDGTTDYFSSKIIAKKTFKLSELDELIQRLEEAHKNDSYAYYIGLSDKCASMREKFGRNFEQALNDRDWFVYNGETYVSMQMFHSFVLDMGFNTTGALGHGVKKYNYSCDEYYLVD